MRWLPVVGFEGRYLISRTGEVFSVRADKPLKGEKHRDGHWRVRLYSKGKAKGTLFYVHHLVLEAFVGPCPEGLVCRHLDGNPANNKLENLRWGTHKENVDDALAHGVRPVGERHWKAKIDVGRVHLIRQLHRFGGLSYREIAQALRTSKRIVAGVVTRKTWAHV